MKIREESPLTEVEVVWTVENSEVAIEVKTTVPNLFPFACDSAVLDLSRGFSGTVYQHPNLDGGFSTIYTVLVVNIAATTCY